VNPSLVPTGYASPCPVFSISPISLTQTSTLSLSATPQAGTDYIYTTAYYAKGTTWLPITLQGNSIYPGYSSAQTQGSLTPTILATLPLGTNYVVVWDWLWDSAAQCYKGPGLNACNTGEWRVQTFTLTSSTYAYSQSSYYAYSQAAYYVYSQAAYVTYSYSQSAYVTYTYSQAAYTGGGTNWVRTGNTGMLNGIWITFDKSGNLYASSSKYGMAVSHDHGVSWTPLNTGTLVNGPGGAPAAAGAAPIAAQTFGSLPNGGFASFVRTVDAVKTP